MATTFYLSGSNSDLSGGADFTKKLVQTVESAGTISMSVAALATDDSYAFTEYGMPGAQGSTGNYSTEINVTILSSRIWASVAWARVDAAGVQQNISSFTAEQNLSSTGVKTFSASGVNLGTWAPGDRLRVTYRFRENDNMGTATFEIGTGTTSEETVTPFTGPFNAASGMLLMF